MADDDWDGFSVFKDRSILTPKIIFGDHGSRDPKLSVKEFYTWLDQLHQDVTLGVDIGIPKVYIEPTKNVLDAFFPIPHHNEARKVVSIRMKESPVTEISQPSKFELDPVHVPYRSGILAITDGPMALAYLFNVAEPSAEYTKGGQLTVGKWVTPLLAVLSRCIYLAYCYDIIEGTAPTADAKINIGAVPVMSNAIWFVEAEDKLPHYLFGSTFVTGDTKGTSGVKVILHRKLMKAWRENEIIAPALASFEPQRALPPKDSPYFTSPTLQTDIAELLHRAIRGISLCSGQISELNKGLTDKTPLLLDDDAKAWITMSKQDLMTPMASAKLKFKGLFATQWPDPVTKAPQKHFELLQTDITDNKAIPGLRDEYFAALAVPLIIVWREKGVYATAADPGIVKEFEVAFKKIFSIWSIPHFFPFKADNPQVKDWAAEFQVVGREQLASEFYDAIWPAAGQKIVDMLYRIYHLVETLEEDTLYEACGKKSRWGRCAETIPACMLLKTMFPERKLLSEAGASQVRGLAMEIRGFNNDASTEVNVFSLADKFNFSTLKAFNELLSNKKGQHPLYEVPCANCQVLLPAMDAPTGKLKYDAQLFTKIPTVYPGYHD